MNDNRRKFLKTFVAVTTGAGFFSKLMASPLKATHEKVKMLTAGGKIVEVERSKVNPVRRPLPATNGEVLEWMQTKNKTS